MSHFLQQPAWFFLTVGACCARILQAVFRTTDFTRLATNTSATRVAAKAATLATA
jgi:hypothetical protein